MPNQINSILLSAPSVSRKKVRPNQRTNFLSGATENERATCIRLIRVMRTNTTYQEGYWLSFFLQGLLTLDEITTDDEVEIEAVEKFIGDMKNFRNWNNWLRGASKLEHFRDHPALAWIREKDKEGKDESDLDSEVRRINDMFLAPDTRLVKEKT